MGCFFRKWQTENDNLSSFKTFRCVVAHTHGPGKRCSFAVEQKCPSSVMGRVVPSANWKCPLFEPLEFNMWTSVHISSRKRQEWFNWILCPPKQHNFLPHKRRMQKENLKMKHLCDPRQPQFDFLSIIKRRSPHLLHQLTPKLCAAFIFFTSHLDSSFEWLEKSMSMRVGMPHACHDSTTFPATIELERLCANWHENHASKSPYYQGSRIAAQTKICKLCIVHGWTILWLSHAHFVNSHRPFCFVASRKRGNFIGWCWSRDHSRQHNKTLSLRILFNLLTFRLPTKTNAAKKTCYKFAHFLVCIVFISLFIVRMFTKGTKDTIAPWWSNVPTNVPTNVSHFPFFSLLVFLESSFSKAPVECVWLQKEKKEQLVELRL